MKSAASKKFVVSVVLLVLALIVQACGREINPEDSCNFVQNSQLQRVSWNNRVLRFYIHNSIPSQYHEDIREAAETWNTTAGRQLISIESVVGGSGVPSRDGYNIIYMLSDWEADKQAEQARTTIYWSGDNIYEADIRVNAKNHQFSAGSVENGKVHMLSLMIHEMGHALGLSHVSHDHSSVMFANLANGTPRDKITEFDASSLSCEY